ncbi:recombinase RecT (plasmid) [Borrelia miyamotoi]|uniref:recombinase RecT n=1 Tax=Borrelia miyamotoi TaxID=47466 RepID=UPI0022B3710B|nr:recombinase RecT [Borrelia miyamotoi]WAZ71185.1 recombinase RecT [Borrelia miyamotoi]
MTNINNITKTDMQNTNNITKPEISNPITDKMNSSNIYEVWEAYKSMHGLKRMDAQSEREILTLLKVNNLNPFKKEAYIIPFNGRYTVVVAYQTLLIRAYEAGYSKYSLEFKEEMVKTIKIDSKGNKIIQDDWQCTAYFKSENGNSYSFSVLFNEYFKNSPIWREKPTFMLRKCAVSCLCRTLPGAGLESMPYIREELGDADNLYEAHKVQQIEYTKTEKIVTKEMHPDYESVTKDDNNHVPSNLSIESEVDNDANTLGTRQDTTEEESKGVETPPIDVSRVVKSNNTIVNKDNTVAVNKDNKANSIKFSCYKSLFIAARRMHKYLINKPFDSISQINAYLNAIKLGDDSSLLEYFNMNKALRNVNYWIELIREYIFKNEHLMRRLDQFESFVALMQPKYEDSPLKLFGFLSREEELRYLFGA